MEKKVVSHLKIKEKKRGIVWLLFKGEGLYVFLF